MAAMSTPTIPEPDQYDGIGSTPSPIDDNDGPEDD